jgi:pimeloyl-ACP methyl ester carboxylesterase
MNASTRPRRRPFVLAAVLLGALVAASGAGIAWNARSAATREAARMIEHRGPVPAPGDPTPADSGMRFSDVPLGARDGTKLAGWWIIPEDGTRRPDLAVVVMAHAADERGKASLLPLAPALHRAGYILLLFDFRSYGGSEGTRTTHGFLEQQDVEAAVRLARERALGAPVAILGQGMGATAALMVAAQDPAIVCVVADSPWHAWDDALFSRPGADSAGGSGYSVPAAARRALGKAIGFGFATDEAREPLVAAPLAASRPVMVIYGETDPFIPFRNQIKVVSAVGTPNATWAWRANGVGHLGAYDAVPDEYRGRVIEFLDASMNAWNAARQDSATAG